MVTPNPQLFESPKARYLLIVIGLVWLGLVVLIAIGEILGQFPVEFTDPIATPFFYLALFGTSSLWVVWQYRRRGVRLRSLLGPLPAPIRWRAILGFWTTLFIFSLGAFQVSFALLSFIFPLQVESILQQSIFLEAGDTAIPWLYNLLTLVILVVIAPVLEEFLFRGFLLHRWGTRWNVSVAVILSSLLFGVLHSNIIGLTVFGLSMALLYLRSQSLGLVILVHSLNNAIAASLDILTRLLTDDSSTSLEEFRAGIWLGLVLVGVSTPFIVRFIQRNWPPPHAELPYFVHRDQPL